MKNAYTKLALLFLFLLPFTQSCQKEELLMSEDKISKQISYTWKRLFMPEETEQTWDFKEGKITIKQNQQLVGEGTYSIDCSMTKVKVSIDGFKDGNVYLNNTWQVISLDDEGLVITDLDKGIMEFEFVRASE